MWKRSRAKSEGVESTDPNVLGRKVAEVTGADRALDQTLERSFAAAPGPVDQAAITKLRLAVASRRDEYMERVGAIYAASYTVSELKALLEFFESDAGRAMRTKNAELQPKLIALTQQFLRDIVSN